MKVSIVYWSSTGNTEAMANAIADGVKEAGAECEVLPVGNADGSVMNSDAIIFGCPAMGAEELEEAEFEPFFAAIEAQLKGKKVGLFGSYGWGDGEWMRTWQNRVVGDGAVLVGDGLIANEVPDDSAIAECKAFGEKAVKS